MLDAKERLSIDRCDIYILKLFLKSSSVRVGSARESVCLLCQDAFLILKWIIF